MGATAARIRAAHERARKDGTKSWTEVVPPQSWGKYPASNIADWQQHLQQDPHGDQLGSWNGKLFNAPAIVYITVAKDASNYSAYDAGAYGYGILLAAAERGVSGIPAFELVRYPKEIRAEFEIPDDESILMGIGLGYPVDAPVNKFVTGRNTLDQVAQFKD